MFCRPDRCHPPRDTTAPEPPPTPPKACVVVRSPSRWQHKPRRSGRYAAYGPRSR
ncbi:hypothetical protein [Actinoplanes sp. NPDC049265]|uniref:hypothetical protein n=1 Tax=Actinoplanes sp. NPDC049265 TaxID=3363902 RepID=UPI0037210119